MAVTIDSRLSPADLDRLRVACPSVDPGASLFARDSVTWRVNREAALLVGGGRALLLQIAHPLVAAGVAAHSRFRERPLERLWRTLDLMLTLVFADAADAIAAVRAIERVHARVRGRLETGVGPFPAGTAYDADQPELLFWVYATLTDSALLAYERFIGPLTAAERVAYYEESKIGARLFGIPEHVVPSTLDGFEAYVDDMIRGDVLTVGAAARDIAASILRPPVPLPVMPVFHAASFFAVGLLPPILRARFGLNWSAGQERVLKMLAAASRVGVPLLPGYLRLMPHARRAARRAVAYGTGRT